MACNWYSCICHWCGKDRAGRLAPAGVPGPDAGREADGTGVRGSTGIAPNAIGVRGTGVLVTRGGEGRGPGASDRDSLGVPGREAGGGDRTGDLSRERFFASPEEAEDFFFLWELEDEEECLTPPSLPLSALREDDEEPLELFFFPEPRAGDGRAGPDRSPEGDLSEPEALPLASEETRGDLPGREVSTSTSIAGCSSMMSRPSESTLSSLKEPVSEVFPGSRRLSWRTAWRARSRSRPPQSPSLQCSHTRQWLPSREQTTCVEHVRWYVQGCDSTYRITNREQWESAQRVYEATSCAVAILFLKTKTRRHTRDKQKQSKTAKQTEGLKGKMACKQPKVLINAVDHFKFAKSEWNGEKILANAGESISIPVMRALADTRGRLAPKRVATWRRGGKIKGFYFWVCQ